MGKKCFDPSILTSEVIISKIHKNTKLSCFKEKLDRLTLFISSVECWVVANIACLLTGIKAVEIVRCKRFMRPTRG